MFVKQIVWLSVPAEEAEVEISDGLHSCVAFSCPCRVKMGDTITDPLHIFSISSARLIENAEHGVWNIGDNSLARRVVGKLIDPATQSLQVGEILFIVDGFLPGGLYAGNIIEIECARIDLW